MTGKIARKSNLGRTVGVGLGAIVLLPIGLISGFTFDVSGVLVLLSRLPAGAVDPWALAGTLGAGAETTGIVSAAAFGLAASSVAGVALAYLAAFFMPHRGTRPERGNGMRRKMFILPHERITPEKEAGIRSCLSFLSQRRRDIHSIVLVGSAAYGADVNGSDIDVVVICGDRGHEAVLEIVCERELAESLQGEQERKYEYTVLSASQAEEQFRMASPFAQSIRHGVVLADDGYLRSLFNAGHPQRPGRQYVMTALSDTITVQYYGSLEALKKERKERRCSDSCCVKRKGYAGLSPLNLMAKTAMRMLYVTLPSRGYVPLTKSDVVEFVRDAYGEDEARAAGQAVSILRNDTASLSYPDEKLLKRFAGKLFEEILGIVGMKRDVVALLKDAARMIRGDYRNLENRHFRACVL